LPGVLGVVEVGLLDLDLRPLGVEFLGDQHRQHGLHALAGLGILGDDRDRAVGGDADELAEWHGLDATRGGGRQHAVERPAPVPGAVRRRRAR
jgi:hypothetical protein